MSRSILPTLKSNHMDKNKNYYIDAQSHFGKWAEKSTGIVFSTTQIVIVDDEYRLMGTVTDKVCTTPIILTINELLESFIELKI